MAHIDLKKYFVEKEHETARPRYDCEKLLKIVLPEEINKRNIYQKSTEDSIPEILRFSLAVILQPFLLMIHGQ